MTAEMVSAWASVGTLLVVLASVLAAFVQLRHMGVLNGLTALNEFREEYERVEGAATVALPAINARLEDPVARAALASGNVVPDWGRPVMPLARMFEILGSYTNRNIVPHEIVTDMWAPVVLRWWEDLTPFIAVMRRSQGSTLFENWEAIAMRSKRCIDAHRSTYPKGLGHMSVVDPWPDD